MIIVATLIGIAVIAFVIAVIGVVAVGLDVDFIEAFLITVVGAIALICVLKIAYEIGMWFLT